MEVSSFKRGARKIAPYVCLVLMALIVSSYNILCEVIFTEGTSSIVFLFYQFMASTLSTALLAFIFERTRRPPLTWKIIGWIFLLALIGITMSQVLTQSALYFVTSTVLSSVSNTTSVVTYALAIIIRKENVHFHNWWEYGKPLGTLLSLSGALTLILWHRRAADLGTTDSTNWAIGLSMLIAGVVCSSVWILMLEPVMRMYPAELSMTTIMMLFATIQTGLIAALSNHNASQWQLHWDLELLNILFGGVLCTGLSNTIYAWCAVLKGAVFLASFTPIGTLFNAILGILFLGHEITPASAIGSIVIVVGLYMFLWSKSKEEAEERVHSEITASFLVHAKQSEVSSSSK